MTTEAVYGAIIAGGERNHPRRRRCTPTYGSENRQPADAGTAFAKDNEASLSERLLDDVEVANDQVCELFDSAALDPSDVNDRWPGRPRGREDRPEVGVSRDQCPVFGAGSVQYRLVGCGVETESRVVQRIMTMLDEDFCQARRKILVDQDLTRDG